MSQWLRKDANGKYVWSDEREPLTPIADLTITSDALGFTEAQLPDFDEDRKRNGFSGIEFAVDPTEPTFRQVKCNSRKEFTRYMKHRGYSPKETPVKFRFYPGELEKAAELVRRVSSG